MTEDEFIFTSIKKGKINKNYYYLIFYDMKNEKEIKSLKLGDKYKDFNNFVSLNEENLLVFGNESCVLVDIINKIVKKEIKFDTDFTKLIVLNKKLFLFQYDDTLKLYKFEENNFELIQEIIFEYYQENILKYPGNKLIHYTSEGKISILGNKQKK